MLASAHFKIKRGKQDDWFDPILDADTELFVDPFLIFKEARGFWVGAHPDIVRHFDRAFVEIAKGNLNPKTLAYQKALALLLFKEPKEFCLGYTSSGTSGLGSGSHFADSIADAICQAIRRGLEHPHHFEELGILNEGIGADRISDITCTILKARFVRYTQEIARRHNVKMARHHIFAASLDTHRQRWESPEVMVPTNPFTGGPLLFAPNRFLRDLPVLNARDWWNAFENERLRQDLNYEIMGNVDKATIVAAARENPDVVRTWTMKKEGEPADAYDFVRDPKGVWQWDAATTTYVTTHPVKLTPPSNEAEFHEAIEKIIHAYQLFIEDQGGWYLLWDGAKAKPEHAPQLLFRGIAQSYCKANDISLDSEVNLGRGPVDFKFSNGYSRRAHLEVKKLGNGKFWDGLEKQLPSYMQSDEVADGWFLALKYNDNKTSQKREKELVNRVDAVAEEKKLSLNYALVDVRPKESASKL